MFCCKLCLLFIFNKYVQNIFRVFKNTFTAQSLKKTATLKKTINCVPSYKTLY